MNNILNEKIEKIKEENDTLTSKLFGRTKKFNDDSINKSDFEIKLKNKNDKINSYLNLNKENSNITINSRMNIPNISKNSYNKQIIVSKKKLTREQISLYIIN